MRTPKQLAASQRRSLRAIKKKLGEMSCVWSDIDNYFASRLEELIEAVKKVDVAMDEFIAEGETDGNC
jgi:hypothetical protein